MRRARLTALFVTVCLLPLGSVVGGSSAGAAPTTPLPPCGGGTTPCLQSVTENGIDVTSDPDLDIVADRYLQDGARYFHFLIMSDDGVNDPFDLDPASTFVVVINTGSRFPGETFARGRDVSIKRGGNATSGYTVRFEMKPVVMSYGACNSMGSCGGSAGNTDATGYLEGYANDLGYVTDPDDRAAMKGFDLASNADWVSSPLQLDYATNTIILDVANSHFMSDGTTVFSGSAEFRLPFAMLRRLYLVDDPASLTAGAFEVRTGSGPAPTVAVAVGPNDVDVDITDVTFSKRRLKISGDTRPGRPRDAKGIRRSTGRGVVRWRPAKSRGSKVRGYKTTCRSGAGHRVGKSTLKSPAVFTTLKAGQRYSCKVRAKSRAGLGKRAFAKIPRRPA